MKASQLKVGDKFKVITLSIPNGPETATIKFFESVVTGVDIDGGGYGKLFTFDFNYAGDEKQFFVTLDPSISVDEAVEKLLKLTDGEVDVIISQNYKETDAIQVFESENESVGPCVVVPTKVWSMVEEPLLKEGVPMEWVGMSSQMDTYEFKK